MAQVVEQSSTNQRVGGSFSSSWPHEEVSMDKALTSRWSDIIDAQLSNYNLPKKISIAVNVHLIQHSKGLQNSITENKFAWRLK